jgi:hypothetical protein
MLYAVNEEFADELLIDFIEWFLQNRTGKYDPENLPKSILDEYKKSIKDNEKHS